MTNTNNLFETTIDSEEEESASKVLVFKSKKHGELNDAKTNDEGSVAYEFSDSAGKIKSNFFQASMKKFICQ